MFRGRADATIDDKSRLKIPADCRRALEERFGPELPEFFVTSIHGDRALLYPLPVWEALEERLAKVPATNPARTKFLERVNFFGLQSKPDGQGRILVPSILRERVGMNGEVVVQGNLDHLVVWNRERISRRLEDEPFSDDDFQALAEHGI